ncbi:MAG: alpha/beta hydrolase [Planctomycetota bacterium]
MTRATPTPSRSSAQPAHEDGPTNAQTASATESSHTLTLHGETGKPVEARVTHTGTAGPRVVFLHGLVGLNEHWEPVVTRLRPGIRSVRLELPLLDLTGSDCSIQGVTELTTAYLDRVKAQDGEGPAVLVGNSFGGHVALRIAHRRPDLVRGLVLAGSSGLFERTLVKGAPIRPPREWLREKIAELFYDPAVMREDDVDRAHAALNTRQGARAMVRLSRTARRNHLGDEIGDIGCPTLLIWGKQDIVTPPSAAQGFLDLMPDAQVVWVDRCGHTPMLEAPTVFAEALESFVARLDGTGDTSKA